MNRVSLWQATVVNKDLIYKANNSCFFSSPAFTKISINSALNSALSDSFKIIPLIVVLEVITAQKPQVYFSRKSNASFKVQRNMPFGCKVTLRKSRMFDFLDFFLSVVCPKIANFKGLTLNKASKNVVSFGLSNVFVFFQLTKCANRFPKDLGLTIIFGFHSTLFFQKALLLTGVQIPVNNSNNPK